MITERTDFVENDEIDWIGISERIACRLKKTFTWLEWDELVGTATLAVVKANNKYDPSRNHDNNRIAYLYMKGYYLSIDILRESKRVLRSYQKRDHVILNETHLYYLMNLQNSEDALEQLKEISVPQEYLYPRACEDLLEGLTEREKDVMRMRYDKEYTFKQIGECLKISDCWAFRIHQNALKCLRKLRSDLHVERI